MILLCKYYLFLYIYLQISWLRIFSCHEVRVTVVAQLSSFYQWWTLKAQSACMDKYLLSSQDEKAIGYRFYPSLHCHLEIKFLSNPWIVVLAMISPFPARMATLPNDLYTVSFTDHLWVWGAIFLWHGWPGKPCKWRENKIKQCWNVELNRLYLDLMKQLFHQFLPKRTLSDYLLCFE